MRRRLALELTALLALAAASSSAAPAPSPIGLLSLVDAGRLEAHVVEVEKWRRCQTSRRRLQPCREGYETAVPFVPEAVTQRVENELEDAWRTFQRRATERIAGEINRFPPCFVPLLCPGLIVNWACVAARQAKGVADALANDLPAYWKDVYAALLRNLPLALWWRSPFPGLGAVLAPVFSLVPKPQQYANLVREPRDLPYYFRRGQEPAVPYARPELGPPGIEAKEEAKRRLERATLLEYERFGFASFFQVSGDFQEVFLMPAMVGVCFAPIPVPFPIPVPTIIPRVPHASGEYRSVPEGYGVPGLDGSPLPLGSAAPLPLSRR